MKKLLFLMLFTASFAFAQCPVEVLRVWPYTGINYDRHTQISYRNTSDKEIRVVKFGLTYLDEASDRHQSHQTWTSDKKLKPGDKKVVRWDNYENVWRYLHAEAYPVKVIFSDDTVWKPEQEGECAGGLPKDVKVVD